MTNQLCASLLLLLSRSQRLGCCAGQSKLTAQDIENIEEVAARPDALRRLAGSLAPSIHGHQLVKAGLVLQLLGGRERVLDNGTHLRGDINCLMVRKHVQQELSMHGTPACMT